MHSQKHRLEGLGMDRAIFDGLTLPSPKHNIAVIGMNFPVHYCCSGNWYRFPGYHNKATNGFRIGDSALEEDVVMLC